jgi:hypothetical protein
VRFLSDKDSKSLNSLDVVDEGTSNFLACGSNFLLRGKIKKKMENKVELKFRKKVNLAKDENWKHDSGEGAKTTNTLY